jgi:hypothetical protein
MLSLSLPSSKLTVTAMQLWRHQVPFLMFENAAWDPVCCSMTGGKLGFCFCFCWMFVWSRCQSRSLQNLWVLDTSSLVPVQQGRCWEMQSSFAAPRQPQATSEAETQLCAMQVKGFSQLLQKPLQRNFCLKNKFGSPLSRMGRNSLENSRKSKQGFQNLSSCCFVFLSLAIVVLFCLSFPRLKSDTAETQDASTRVRVEYVVINSHSRFSLLFPSWDLFCILSIYISQFLLENLSLLQTNKLPWLREFFTPPLQSRRAFVIHLNLKTPARLFESLLSLAGRTRPKKIFRSSIISGNEIDFRTFGFLMKDGNRMLVLDFLKWQLHKQTDAWR